MFSKNEKILIKVLGRKKMSIRQLTDKVYGDDWPMDANNRVAAMVRRIKTKCEHLKLCWSIDSTGGGRAGKTVWKKKL